MNKTTMDKIWWDFVTSAQAFITGIVDLALKSKSILLAVPKNMPWKQYFMDCVCDKIKAENSECQYNYINSENVENVGEYMLENYCGEEEQLKYRYGSHAKFLAECKDIVLHKSIIWVNNILQDKLDEWKNFVSTYCSNVNKHSPCAVFILETSDESAANKRKKAITPVLYKEMINDFDYYAFCVLAVSDIKESERLKTYLAELVANVCGDDVELCSKCILNYNEYLNDPYNTLRRIIDENTDGEEFKYDKSEIDNLVWKSQIKIIFPIIEDYRQSFIKNYRAQLERLLPMESHPDYKEPEDIEIGALEYLVSSEKSIYINDQEFDNLHKFKNARNTLAHLGILSFKDIKELL